MCTYMHVEVVVLICAIVYTHICNNTNKTNIICMSRDNLKYLHQKYHPPISLNIYYYIHLFSDVQYHIGLEFSK